MCACLVMLVAADIEPRVSCQKLVTVAAVPTTAGALFIALRKRRTHWTKSQEERQVELRLRG